MSAGKDVAVPAAADGKQVAKREDVVLTKDHIHDREQRRAGETIAVLPHQKAWLLELEKIGPSKGETK